MDGGQVEAWADAQDLVAHAVTLYHLRPGCQVLMVPDAPECHRGSFVTQVPDEEMGYNVPVEDMTHEPSAFLSGTFTGSQMSWTTIDKEGFAIVSTTPGAFFVEWGPHFHLSPQPCLHF